MANGWICLLFSPKRFFWLGTPGKTPRDSLRKIACPLWNRLYSIRQNGQSWVHAANVYFPHISFPGTSGVWLSCVLTPFPLQSTGLIGFCPLPLHRSCARFTNTRVLSLIGCNHRTSKIYISQSLLINDTDFINLVMADVFLFLIVWPKSLQILEILSV